MKDLVKILDNLALTSEKYFLLDCSWDADVKVWMGEKVMLEPDGGGGVVGAEDEWVLGLHWHTFNLPTTYLLPTTFYLPSTTYYLPPSTYYLLPTTYNLPTSTYLLHTYNLLPTTYLQPTTYYLLPTDVKFVAKAKILVFVE